VSAAPSFLSTLPASRGQRRLAATVVLVSLAFFVAAVPFAKAPLVHVPAFIPIYASALVVNDTMTAVLLLGQFLARRAMSLLVLAGAYVFTAAVTIAHALSFPDVFAPGGLLGAGAQTTVWLYMFWHGGFPLVVLVYAWWRGARSWIVDEARVTWAIAATLVVALGVAAAVIGLATLGQGSLPVLLRGGQYSNAYVVAVSIVWGASAVALLALWRRPGRRTVLDVWLMVTLCAWLLDVALSAMLNEKRFDLGFYAGRAYGLLASSFVLTVLLVESTLLHGRLAKAHRRERDERRRLAAKERELQAANRELDAFAYSVSHDLRAPLRAIDGYSRMIEEDYGDRLDAEGQRLLGVVRSSTASMGQLIEDLLAFSRAGRAPVAARDVPLEPLVRQVIADLAPQWEGRAVDFVVVVPGSVHADPALLRQVFANLLGNAIKFTRERAPARIEVGREAVPGAADVIFVRDNGAGFDMQHAGRLFGVFQRLHSAQEFPGTGVGLAIVARIIARHGGRIWPEAAPDRGAVFRFTLAADA